MDDSFLEAMAEVMREQLSHQNDVKLEGIGMFKFEHRPQYQQQYQDGSVHMMPPKDVVKFVSDYS